jgi:hypothetical protein
MALKVIFLTLTSFIEILNFSYTERSGLVELVLLDIWRVLRDGSNEDSCRASGATR